MLKMLIIGADAVSPEIVYKNQHKLPNLKKLIDIGASGSYSAYVQKGYSGSYSSEQNWASIYTGLAPQEHLVETKYVNNKRICTQMKHFNGLLPFWTVLNNNGLSVGLWAADNCSNPIAIQNGYVVSAKYSTIESPTEERSVAREIQICEKDLYINDFLEGMPPSRIYPKTLLQQGYNFEQLKLNPDLADEALAKYNYEECLDNFRYELEYWFGAIGRAQNKKAVDVLFFYTPTTDLIAHCTMNCDDNPVLISAYQILDEYIGKLTSVVNPEITVFVSDHGQQNFKELIKCSDKQVQKEAFSARDEVVWLNNGYIAFEAHNGSLLYTAHSLKGTFIASGYGIKHTKINEMRTLDIYPTILEMLNIKIPSGRKGYIMNIFEKNVINKNKVLDNNSIEQKSIALIASVEVNIVDIIINELYLANRFCSITVVGYEKYGEIFSNNPRVSAFIPYELFDLKEYDEVYCSVATDNGKYLNHVKIYGRDK